MTTQANELHPKNKKTTYKLIIAIIVAGMVLILMRLYEQEHPQITLLNAPDHIGISREINFAVTDARSGIQDITIELVQKENKSTVYQKTLTRQGYFSHAGPNRLEESFQINTRALKFKNGEAAIEITVHDFSFWNWMAGNQSTRKYPVVIDTKPPLVTIVQAPRYIKSGGSGIVIYQSNEAAASHGVTINGHFYPGYLQEGPKGERFVSYIGIPFDTKKIDEAMVTVTDSAGNQGRAAISMILKKAAIKSDRINISNNFLNLKLPEFARNYPEMSGTPVEQYIYVNNEIRRKNAEEISRTSRISEQEQLWQGRFKRMNGSRRASFPDHRTYLFQGEEIDQQFHLGIDLASTRHAEVRAANHGKVVFADYLGIYGNTVILDHGQGLFSLYAHLSQINVTLGDMVRQDKTVGLSGTSGMAGGDHLHFSILINGIFVNPLEWWDEQWLKLNIEQPLAN